MSVIGKWNQPIPVEYNLKNLYESKDLLKPYDDPNAGRDVTGYKSIP